jgi:phosphoribosylanthranilate isomerase
MRLFSSKNKSAKVKFKVCGITRTEDIEACAKLHVDAVGFLLGDGKRNEISDKLNENEIRDLINAVPSQLSSVVLIKEIEFEKIQRSIVITQPNVLQLQNPLLSVAVMEEVKRHNPTIELIRTIRLTEKTNLSEVYENIQSLSGLVDAILLDSEKGGSGKSVDWDLASQISTKCQDLSMPLVLAGGLKPENVKIAVEIVRPYMIDIMSGVSIQPGIKDINKIQDITEILKTIV